MSGAVEGVALLPCPFCGSAPVTEVSGMSNDGMMISCINRKCAGPHCSYIPPSAAVTAWNTRTTPPARSYADGLAVAAKHLDERAERARVAAIGGGMDPLDAELLDYEYSNAAAAIRLLSQGEKA